MLSLARRRRLYSISSRFRSKARRRAASKRPASPPSWRLMAAEIVIERALDVLHLGHDGVARGVDARLGGGHLGVLLPLAGAEQAVAVAHALDVGVAHALQDDAREQLVRGEDGGVVGADLGELGAAGGDLLPLGAHLGERVVEGLHLPEEHVGLVVERDGEDVLLLLVLVQRHLAALEVPLQVVELALEPLDGLRGRGVDVLQVHRDVGLDEGGEHALGALGIGVLQLDHREAAVLDRLDADPPAQRPGGGLLGHGRRGDLGAGRRVAEEAGVVIEAELVDDDGGDPLRGEDLELGLVVLVVVPVAAGAHVDDGLHLAAQRAGRVRVELDGGRGLVNLGLAEGVERHPEQDHQGSDDRRRPVLANGLPDDGLAAAGLGTVCPVTPGVLGARRFILRGFKAHGKGPARSLLGVAEGTLLRWRRKFKPGGRRVRSTRARSPRETWPTPGRVLPSRPCSATSRSASSTRWCSASPR